MNTQPNIVISSLDAERLEALLASLPRNAFPGRTELEAELSRADIVEPTEIPPTVVTMNSTVRFRVESSAEEFTLTLVYPRDMDSSSDKISILAPVGSALLGLSQGDEIEWPKPGGGTLRVRIEEVLYQPERAGEYHR
jgi:regulator of nucleoside diphosphate kinase